MSDNPESHLKRQLAKSETVSERSPEWIYFSYQDENGETQHASVSTEQAGELIGKLMTCAESWKRFIKDNPMVNTCDPTNPQPQEPA